MNVLFLDIKIHDHFHLPLDNSKKQLQIGTKNNGEPVYIGINRYNLIGFSNFKYKLSKDLYNFSLNASHKKSESVIY